MKLFDKIKGVFGKNKKEFSYSEKVDKFSERSKAVPLQESRIAGGNNIPIRYNSSQRQTVEKVEDELYGEVFHVKNNKEDPQHKLIIEQIQEKSKINQQEQNSIREKYKEIDRLVRIQNKTKNSRSKKKLQKRIENLQNKIDKGVK